MTIGAIRRQSWAGWGLLALLLAYLGLGFAYGVVAKKRRGRQALPHIKQCGAGAHTAGGWGATPATAGATNSAGYGLYEVAHKVQPTRQLAEGVRSPQVGGGAFPGA